MRCAVLGAGGFIGINLCQALLREGNLVRAFGRQQLSPEELEGCEWISGDFSNTSDVSAAINGCEIVFHLVTATTPATANVDKVADLNSNVTNTLHFLDVCLTSGVRKVVFVSSGGTVYGVPDQVPTSESAATNPISAYGISKLAIEKYLGLYKYLYGLDYIILRVSNPFGPFQLARKNQGVIAAFLERVFEGKSIEMWGDGSVTRDYIYIDDVVKALIVAAKYDGVIRIFNIGSGTGRSLKQIASAIDECVDVPISIVHLPSRAVDVPVNILDISLAANDLGWSPGTSFKDGLNFTFDWMRRSKNIK
jgi:UDP-glucose 4-epimerase